MRRGGGGGVGWDGPVVDDRRLRHCCFFLFFNIVLDRRSRTTRKSVRVVLDEETGKDVDRDQAVRA